jgi:hypothetical protein
MLPYNYSFFKEVGIDLNKYDFSKVRAILIPSVKGIHYPLNDDMFKFGIGKVKHIIENFGPKFESGTLAYCSSSV